MKRKIKGYMLWDWTNEKPFFQSDEHEATVFIAGDNCPDIEEWMEEEGQTGLPVEITITKEGMELIQKDFEARQDNRSNH